MSVDLEPIKQRLAEYLLTGPAESPDQMGVDMALLIAEVEQLRTSLDEAEERYDWLLDQIGGVSPG